MSVERLKGDGAPAAVLNSALRAPVGEAEELIAALWAGVLECDEELGREQDFFELGGDSLSAAEVAVRMGEALGVRVGIMEFARQPTIAGLAQLAGRLRATAAGEPDVPLLPALADTPQPLSFAQEAIWEHCHSLQSGAGYELVASIRILGALNIELLRSCLEQLIHRHSALRARFPVHDGRPTQVIDPPRTMELLRFDASSAPDPRARAAELLRELASERFDLEHGPLLRFGMVRLAEKEYRLLRISHHITCDGASWRLFMRELAVLYEADVRGEPLNMREFTVSYGDVATWQRERLRPGSEGYHRLLGKWSGTPERATVPPFARPTRAEDVAPQDGVIGWGLPSVVTEGLEHLGREAGATYYMVRLALFAALLAVESGKQELLLGTYVSTRRQPETLGMFGCFTQLVPLWLSLSPEATVRSWLATVREAVLETNEYSAMPYERLAQEMELTGRSLPPIATLFATKESDATLQFAGLEVWPSEHLTEHYMPSGFSFLVDRWSEEDGCLATFDASIYDPGLVRAFIERYRRLAGELIGDLHRPLWKLVQALPERGR